MEPLTYYVVTTAVLGVVIIYLLKQEQKQREINQKLGEVVAHLLLSHEMSALFSRNGNLKVEFGQPDGESEKPPSTDTESDGPIH